MIDTIVIRLNNVDKYNIIKTQFQAKSTTGATTVAIDEDTGEVQTNAKIHAMVFHDSGDIIPITKRSSINIASSHYSVSYVYNAAQSYIEFDFSLPKYLWGTNIIQFIRYYSQSPDDIYSYFIDFVTGFVKKHFFQSIDMVDLQLRRIDLCYNQFFNSKHDAITYLNEQKELLKKFARSTKNDFRSYETSLMYMTKRYSFKIYHKGTEFHKHDKKQLVKKNPTNEHIDYLQDVSDRILRYEVTLRKAQINYLFEQAEMNTKYMPMMFNGEYRANIKQASPEHYKRCMEFAEKSKSFVFENMGNLDAVNTSRVFFSYSIFKLCYDFFWNKVRDYQLQMKKSVFDIVQKVDELNEQKDKVRLENKKLRREMSYNKPMIVALALLTQYYSLDDLKKSKLLPDRTFYHYKKKLKEVGIDSDTRLSDMPPPALDYSDYKFIFGRHHLK